MWCLSTLFIYFYEWATCSYFLFSLHRDLLRIGVTLAGHQKKILGSIQDMRLQMNQTLPVQVWSDRTQTDAVKGQPDRKTGQELNQREPLENPSCLIRLCHLFAMKLACSASDYFFLYFTTTSISCSCFLLVVIVSLSIQSEFVCFWKRIRVSPHISHACLTGSGVSWCLHACVF